MRRAICIAALAVVALATHHADASSCHERSYVVGYEHCTWFATWSRDADVWQFHFEMGWLHHDFDARPFSIPPHVLESTGFATTSDGLVMRYLSGRGRFLYYGGELEYGAITTQPELAGLPAGDGALIAGRAVVGLHASLWRLAFGAELDAGGRSVSYDYCGSQTNCSLGADQGTGELGARVRADLFVAPRFSLGVAYGHSLVARDDHLWLLSVGVHLCALDGMY